jgi:hypothetical protein
MMESQRTSRRCRDHQEITKMMPKEKPPNFSLVSVLETENALLIV